MCSLLMTRLEFSRLQYGFFIFWQTRSSSLDIVTLITVLFCLKVIRNMNAKRKMNLSLHHQVIQTSNGLKTYTRRV